MRFTITSLVLRTRVGGDFKPPPTQAGIQIVGVGATDRSPLQDLIRIGPHSIETRHLLVS